METFRVRSMSLSSGYLSYPTSVRAMWRLAFYKAGKASRVVTDFLKSEQGQLSKQLMSNHALRAGKSTKFPAKTYQPTMKQALNGLAHHTTTAVQENTTGVESKNKIEQFENYADMSPAQVVFAVIHKQQVEWMNDTNNAK